MTVPLTAATETDEIHREIVAAHDALDRYHDLTTFEYRAQKERLASIEERLGNLEQAVTDLHGRINTLYNSRIWRTLMRAGSLLERVAGRA